MVSDTTCPEFISCLKRLFGRRGYPKLFISDNAKCFVGAELKRFLKFKGIDWKFIQLSILESLSFFPTTRKKFYEKTSKKFEKGITYQVFSSASFPLKY